MRICTAWLLTLVLGASLVAAEEPAYLSGSVSLAAAPAPAKKRISRGSRYRQRSSVTDATANAAATTVSPYADLVVAAHPLSFAARLDPQAEPGQIEQREVAFKPPVLAITKGSTVQFINRDKIFHNVFTLTEGAKFDIGRRKTGVVVQKTIEIAGEIDLFCDIHPQMNATILSLDTPYFVAVDKNGRFVMPPLPPGRYEIRVSHPDLSGAMRAVELTAGDSTVVGFSLGNYRGKCVSAFSRSCSSCSPGSARPSCWGARRSPAWRCRLISSTRWSNQKRANSTCGGSGCTQ